jgi:glycosyltransferase involved in cell wall biosynthesis
MLGTSMQTMGGIASVIKAYRSAGVFENWQVNYIETHTDGGRIRKMRFAVSAWIRFVACLARSRNCIVHVHSASRASFWRKSTFILPAMWTGVPVIFHLHGGGFMQFYCDECGGIRKRFVRYVLDKSAQIIVLSEAWRHSIRTITSNPRIIVLPNPGPSLPVIAQSQARQQHSILFLGRINEEKGVYTLLKAFAKVLTDFPQARLIFAGSGEIDKLNDVSDELGIRDSVETLGWVDDEQRAELLATVTIFVLPSFTEGLPMSLLEAMAAALPIVATPVGGIPDVIRNDETGIIVPVDDALELSNAICRVLADRPFRESLGQCAQAELRKRFDLSVVIPQLESVYRELGAKPRMAI